MRPHIFYHATSEENALRIQEGGFVIPDGPGGFLGPVVYCSSTLSKALDYLKGPAWAPFSVVNPGDKGKQENCVKDPRRIKVVHVLAGSTGDLRLGGFDIIIITSCEASHFLPCHV